MATRSNPPPDPGDPRLMSGRAWERLCEALQRAGSLPGRVGDSPRNHAEGYRHLTRFLAAGIASCVAHDDGDHPIFGRMIDYAMPWGLDNPDCLYLYAGVRGDTAYRVHGWRGSANHIDLQLNAGHFASGDIASWETLDSIDGVDLETGDDGRFELLIAPEDGPGNRLRSDARAGFVLVRQYFNDWENERPADLLIERLDGDYPIPPPRSDRIADQLERLTTWIDEGGALWENMSRALRSGAPNSLVIHRPEDSGERTGMAGQAYGMGNFRCAEGEAVLLEFSPPACRHWSVSLANPYWEAIEYATRQSSLNGHQARIDSDGRFRAVIAHEDPAVPNWLDTAGHPSGSLAVRFLRAASAPEVTMRVLPQRDVRAALPADTPRVSPEQRAARLERRRRAVWLRHRR